MNKLKDFLKGLKKGQKKFGENISIIINSILLSFVYFIGVGLTAITAKIVRKRFLDLEMDKICKTYWSELNIIKKPLKEYYRQF